MEILPTVRTLHHPRGARGRLERLGVALESGSDGISAALTAGLRVIAVVPKDMTGGTDRLTLVSDLRDVDLAAAREALCADRALSRGPAGSALGDTA